MVRIILLNFLVCSSIVVYGQSYKKKIYKRRLFQFSVAPGLGSSGLNPGDYINYFSLNLTAGYAAANQLLEVAGISNFHTEYTRGLQFSGVINVTGGNAFVAMSRKEAVKKVEAGWEGNLYGAQFSGLANVVMTNVFGLQVSGGVNLSKSALFGLQFAGVANVVGNYSFGLQVAGVYNASANAMDGVQIASLFNFTGGKLQGIQISAYNRAGKIEGKNSWGYNGSTGLQIGLINSSAKMNGFQVGLVNFGGQMQGTQIGLINFYTGGDIKDTKDGTSIGLLNIGQTYNVQVYADEIFFNNYAFLTGTGKNLRIIGASRWVYIKNALIFGYNPNILKKDGTEWMIGYGLYRYVYNRSNAPGMNEFRFISTGAEVLHYNKGKDLDDNINLICRVKVSVGSKIHPKVSGVYLFGGVTYNLMISDQKFNVSNDFLKDEEETNGKVIQKWPGIHFGVMLH